MRLKSFNPMGQKFLKELFKIKDKKHVDHKIFSEFVSRIEKGDLTRNDNPFDHCCTFFLPVNIESQSVYLGHHINADMWLPPGGHIEKKESPYQAVQREMNEELNIQSNDYKIELFDLSITDIFDKKRTCRKHYDFWYLIPTSRVKFSFDKREFFQADWLLLDLAIDRSTHKNVTLGLSKLKKYYS